MAVQIGQVSQRTGLSVDTIRFYEKQALVPAPRRSESGYRVYAEHDIDRLKFIGRAQRLGFSLQEIRELLLVECTQEGSCSHVSELISAKIVQVREKISELKRLELRLTKAQQQCQDALVSACDSECPVLQELQPQHAQKEKQ